MKNKPLAFLLSVVVAFGLWLFVITTISPESEKTYHEIPVVIQGKNILEERGLMIVSEEPKVTLDLRSTRTILNNLNEANINVMTNVSNIEEPGEFSLTYSISYPGNIPNNEISVQRSSTDLITLKVEKKLQKLVPVVIDYDGTAVPGGYRSDLTNPQLDFVNIEISGPESVAGQIEKAVIHVDLNGKTTALAGEYQYTLCDKFDQPVNAEKITVNTDKVNLLINIYQVKDLPVKYDILYGNGATENNCTVTVKPEVIAVAGTDGTLANLNELIIDAIDLNAIQEDMTQIIKIADLLPPGVKNISGVEEITVQVVVDVAIETVEIPVDKKTVECPNLPEGMQIKKISPESGTIEANAPLTVTVTVRGTTSLVEALKTALSEDKLPSEALTVKITLDDAQEESKARRGTVEVTFSGDYESLGVTVEDKVIVTLEEIPTNTPSKGK